MMKRMLIALLACLSVSSLYALNEEERTIEYPKGVTCHFEGQGTKVLVVHRDAETIDNYTCGGEGQGFLSVVYYPKSEDEKEIRNRIQSIHRTLTSADHMYTDYTSIFYVVNKSQHLIRVFRFDSDKRIEYVFLADDFEKVVKDNDFIRDMEKLEVPATPVTTEE